MIPVVRTLYRASRVHSLSHPASGDWVLVDGRHVQRVGSGEPPAADRVVELPGATIVPGFIDAHVHLTATGVQHSDQRTPFAKNAQDLLEIARERVATAPQDQPVILRGFDEGNWTDPRFPSLSDLDSVTARPLVIERADGHLALANTATIEAAGLNGLDGTGQDPQGGTNGVITAAAVTRMHRWLAGCFTDTQIEEMQLQAAALAASRGVTSVHEMSMNHEIGNRDLKILMSQRKKLPVDVVPFVATTDIAHVIDLGLRSIGGDIHVDGSIGAHTAWLSSKYEDADGQGISFFDDEKLATYFLDAHMAGLQAGVHAIGDAAIEQVLTVWERIYSALDSRQRRHFRARRHRIEHFEMPSTSQMERAAALGLGACVQPSFDNQWGKPDGLYSKRVGAARARSMNPFRSLVERGLEIGIGSDSPVTPLDPMASISAMEEHHDPNQSISRSDAFRLHTVGSARLAHMELKKGTLGQGMHADLVAYEVDPFDLVSVEGLRPILTVSLGREVFVS